MDLMQILQSGVIPAELFTVLEARFGYYLTAANAYDLITYIIYLQQRIVALEAFANIVPQPAPQGIQ